MRYLLLAVVVLGVFVSCKKSDYTTAPQIKFKSITSVFASNSTNVLESPILTLEITDKEGDLGFLDGKDTSYIYIKNLTVPPFKIDSFKFPAALSGKKDFKADVDIALRGDGTPGSGVLSSSIGIPRPFTDTLYFEVYVKDFAKNKSNVIRTDDPLYYVSP